jgi:integrase/recombinase XerD
MSVLSVTELAPIIRDLGRAMKDKSYQRSPIGREVMRYLRALRWQESSPNTLEAYELVLARFALWFADYRELAEFCTPVGTDYIQEFLDHYWGDLSPATRQHRLSVVRAFFTWAVEERKIGYDPSRPIKAPRGRSTIRIAHTRETTHALTTKQDSLRDEACLLLYVRLGLRKMDVGLLQILDIDLPRDVIALRHVKGGGEVLMPIEDEETAQALYLTIVGDDRQPEEYLLHPRNNRLKPMHPVTVHRWFKRCLAKAGLPDNIVLHELRHTAADELYRETKDIVLAQQLLRHKSIETTRRYLHPSDADLRAGLRQLAESRRTSG